MLKRSVVPRRAETHSLSPCPSGGRYPHACAMSALDLLPLVDPLVVGRAVVATAVDALLLRRGPVVDLGRELLVGRVVDVAEVLLAGVLTRLHLRRRFAEVFGH